MKKKKILITCLNGPISYELVNYLKNFFYIIGCDENYYGLGNKVCDEFYKSPNGKSKKFIKFLLRHEKKVDQIFLYSDEELINVAKNVSSKSLLFRKLLISPFKTINLCNNKFKLMNYLKSSEFNFPPKSGSKIIIKPKIGRGSKNQLVLSKKAFNSFIKNKIQNNYIVEKFIEGKEYTVDCIFDKNHRLVDHLARERIVKSNLSIVCRLNHSKIIKKFILKISKKIPFVGIINIQFIIDKKNKIFLTDINPRPSGSIIFTLLSGLNLFVLSNNILFNKKLKNYKKIKSEKIYIRYWQTYKK